MLCICVIAVHAFPLNYLRYPDAVLYLLLSTCANMFVRRYAISFPSLKCDRGLCGVTLGMV